MTRRSQVTSRAGATGELSSLEVPPCAVSTTPMSPQRHIKRPQSICQKRKWQVMAKHALNPLTERCRSGLTMPLPRHSDLSEKKQAHTLFDGEHSSQSFQLAQPLWTDAGLKIGLVLTMPLPRHSDLSEKKQAHTQFDGEHSSTVVSAR